MKSSTMDNTTTGHTPLGLICGIIGGMTSFFLQINVVEPAWWEKTIQAGGTALICGFLGIVGKECYIWIKAAFSHKKKKRNGRSAGGAED